MSDDLTQAVSEAEVEALRKRNAELEQLLARPIGVTVASPDATALNRIVEYLPQLTYIATNLSSVASAIQASNGTLVMVQGQLGGIAKEVAALRAELHGGEEDADESDTSPDA